MKLSIIKDDKIVTKDLVSVAVADVSYIPSNVHAVQWDGSKGEVEYNDGTPNLEISELGIYEQASTDHQTAIDAQEASKKAEEDAVDWSELFRRIRDEKLLETDWTRLDDVTLVADKKVEWATYRQALRDLPATKSATDKELVNDANHSEWPKIPS